jgi:hypothetical protein
LNRPIIGWEPVGEIVRHFKRSVRPLVRIVPARVLHTRVGSIATKGIRTHARVDIIFAGPACGSALKIKHWQPRGWLRRSRLDGKPVSLPGDQPWTLN